VTNMAVDGKALVRRFYEEMENEGRLEVADEICAVSYLAGSGFTLTVVLNFRDHRMVGYASGAKEWFPVGGTFEVVK